MKTVVLTQGFYASVDDEDYEWLNQFKWFYHNGYAKRTVNDEHVRMHDAIAEHHGLVFAVGELDHKDRNKINNQKSNFRSATPSQQQVNKDRIVTNKSGYIGVCWHKRDKKWAASISYSGKRIHLGNFMDKVAAAKAYDAAAVRYFGEFAMLNFQPEVVQ